jgi:hypothetical protein
MWIELPELMGRMMPGKIDITYLLEQCKNNLDTQEVIIELYRLSEYLEQEMKNE